MARIRTIKPEFWQDEKLAPCEPVTRLVFLGLISMADDAGRVLDNVKIIDAFIFPETSETCRRSLDDLSAKGRIRRGKTASGQSVIQIVNWAAHQKVEKPNLRGALPPIVVEAPSNHTVTDIPRHFADESTTSRGNVDDASENHTNDLRPTTYDRRPYDRTDSQATQPVDRSAYAEQEQELRAAGLPHECLALDLLMSRHPAPYIIVLELHAFASGLHVIRGEHTGRVADAADVMRAIAEMASNGAQWSTKLFRGYLRRIADRPPEPLSAEEREAASTAAKVEAEARRLALVVEPVDTRSEDEKAEAARRRAEAMERFRAMYRGHNPGDRAA